MDNYIIEVKINGAKAFIEDGEMLILGEPSKMLIDNILAEMESKDIKRIVFTCSKGKELKNLHPALTEITGVKTYHKFRDGKFKEEEVRNVFQIHNPEGHDFYNGPFQKCKVCNNWFKFQLSELEFFEENKINPTRTCKECRGRKLIKN